MAGHRSPDGRRARVALGPSTAQHRSADAPAPTKPSLRTNLLATAAAVGAVATGAFTALVPTPGDGTATSAAADEVQPTAWIATAASVTTSTATDAALLPVSTVDESLGTTDRNLARLDKAATIATRVAALHAAEQAEQARLDAAIDRGGVDGWVAQALTILDLPQSVSPAVKKIIMAESGGNPRAINKWDSNARRGTPSQGLMQTIPSTYRHYVHPRVADRPITDPVANITAGVRYMIDNYGLGTLQSGGRSNARGSYVGY